MDGRDIFNRRWGGTVLIDGATNSLTSLALSDYYGMDYCAYYCDIQAPNSNDVPDLLHSAIVHSCPRNSHTNTTLLKYYLLKKQGQ